ncbi:MAG: hypothetical protein IPN74_16780 [Haliscomenobacter sp.]|nr:hypothetical protein [Haliscomenobacter sp.]
MNLLYFPIDQGPLWFCIALGAVLLLTLLLEHLETRFVKNKAQREQPFTMLDLEFPADRQDLERVLWDIARLGEARALRVRRAIRTHLFLDYLFMPFAYGAIFFLSMLVAGKFPAGSAGQTGFALLAWAQLIAWACDIAENAVLWRQVRQDPQPMSKLVFNSFVTLVWGNKDRPRRRSPGAVDGGVFLAERGLCPGYAPVFRNPWDRAPGLFHRARVGEKVEERGT